MIYIDYLRAQSELEEAKYERLLNLDQKVSF